MTTSARRSTGTARLIGFRVAAGLTGLLLLLAGLQALLAPWLLPADTGDTHAAAHRWFITVAGAADTSGAVVILALAIRPRTALLAMHTLAGVAIASLVNLPVDPWFGVLLLVLTPMLVLYPYWPDVDEFRSWWSHPIKPLLWTALVTTSVVGGVASACLVHQFTAHDTAAAANWWADYAEHLTLLGVGLLFAATGQPGWRLITASTSVAWIYLGMVAAFVIPEQTASWGTHYAPLGVLVGVIGACMMLRRRGSDDPALRTPVPPRERFT